MKTLKHTYRPLPSALTIKESPIEGLGLFVKDKKFDFNEIGINFTTYGIKRGTFIGVTHIHSAIFENENFDFEPSLDQNEIIENQKMEFTKDELFENGLIRLPLGGFINHSDDPNVNMIYLDHGCWGIISIKDIGTGDEITVDYKYTPCGVINPK